MEASAIPTKRLSLSGYGVLSPRLLKVASDERLVAVARAGHVEAFEAIYERHHRGLLSFCRHMLGSRDEAEDAVQQTFFSAHGSLSSSERPIQLKAWLYTIARNRCLTTLRARRDQSPEDELEVPTEGLADEVERRADLQELLVDLRRLPDDQREALVLAELGALTHDEIANVLHVPGRKVKALIFQARRSLLATRSARETPCEQIRAEIATTTGAAARRSALGRHVRDCPGCREFRDQVKLQRAAFAIVLPVVPTLALKHASLPVATAAHAVAGGASGGGLLAGGAKVIALKAVAVAAVAGAGVGGSLVTVHELRGDRHDGILRNQSSHAPARPAPAERPSARRSPPNDEGRAAAAGAARAKRLGAARAIHRGGHSRSAAAPASSGKIAAGGSAIVSTTGGRGSHSSSKRAHSHGRSALAPTAPANRGYRLAQGKPVTHPGPVRHPAHHAPHTAGPTTPHRTAPPVRRPPTGASGK